MENLPEGWKTLTLIHPCGRFISNLTKKDIIFRMDGKHDLTPSWWQSCYKLTEYDTSFLKDGKCALAPFKWHVRSLYTLLNGIESA